MVLQSVISDLVGTLLYYGEGAKISLGKPHKLMFLHCLKELAVSNENSIFIGDHPVHDIQGAKSVPMRCIWIERKEYPDIPTKPDWTAESISKPNRSSTKKG